MIEEDQKLALRISLTNQKAKSRLIDLDGNEVELTIPELLVIKNNIAPKLERATQSIPKLAKGVERVYSNLLKSKEILGQVFQY